MLTFSEWAEEDPLKRRGSDGQHKSTTASQTSTVEVPLERPKLYPDRPRRLVEHITEKEVESGSTLKALGAQLKFNGRILYSPEGVDPREKRLMAGNSAIDRQGYR